MLTKVQKTLHQTGVRTTSSPRVAVRAAGFTTNHTAQCLAWTHYLYRARSAQPTPIPALPFLLRNALPTGDTSLCPPNTPPSPHHPVQRTLYERAPAEASAAASASEDEDAGAEGRYASAPFADEGGIPGAEGESRETLPFQLSPPTMTTPTQRAAQATDMSPSRDGAVVSEVSCSPRSSPGEDPSRMATARKMSPAPSRGPDAVAPGPRLRPEAVSGASDAAAAAVATGGAGSSPSPSRTPMTAVSSCGGLDSHFTPYEGIRDRRSGGGGRGGGGRGRGGGGGAGVEGSTREADIYGRSLDRSFQAQGGGRGGGGTGGGGRRPRTDEEEDSPSYGGRPASEQRRPSVAASSAEDGGDRRVALAERRAEAAESAGRAAAAAAAAAAREARAAQREVERLRAEGLELSRWREAVLSLRDELKIAGRGGREGEGGNGAGGEGPRRTDGGKCLSYHQGTEEVVPVLPYSMLAWRFWRYV